VRTGSWPGWLSFSWLTAGCQWSQTALPFRAVARHFKADSRRISARPSAVRRSSRDASPARNQSAVPARTRVAAAAAAKGSRRSCRGCGLPRSSARGGQAAGGGARRSPSPAPGGFPRLVDAGRPVTIQLAFFLQAGRRRGNGSSDHVPVAVFKQVWPEGCAGSQRIAELVHEQPQIFPGPGPPATAARNCRRVKAVRAW